VESGRFVGKFRDQEYGLGSTEGEAARAIRKMSELRREAETMIWMAMAETFLQYSLGWQS
jgi:hypothetical protein